MMPATNAERNRALVRAFAGQPGVAQDVGR